MLTVTDVSLQFAGSTLYKHVDLKFAAGNCYGIIGANGVEEVLSPTLTESEQAKFHASCEHIRANIAQLAWWNDECHPMLRG